MSYLYKFSDMYGTRLPEIRRLNSLNYLCFQKQSAGFHCHSWTETAIGARLTQKNK